MGFLEMVCCFIEPWLERMEPRGRKDRTQTGRRISHFSQSMSWLELPVIQSSSHPVIQSSQVCGHLTFPSCMLPFDDVVVELGGSSKEDGWNVTACSSG